MVYNSLHIYISYRILTHPILFLPCSFYFATNTKLHAQQYILIEMSESLADISPANPATRKGAVISIGFDKNTKLALVLEHFVDFLNRYPLDPPTEADQAKEPCPTKSIPAAEWRIRNQVSTGQLEFYHAEVLRLHESFEGAAVMKADKIRCRRKRDRRREDEFIYVRRQREADRDYFKRMARLLTQSSDATGVAPCDTVFYCTGKLVEDGRRQEVLTPIVRAHSVMCCKRSQYLRRLIAGAKEEREQEELLRMQRQEFQERSNREAREQDGEEEVPAADGEAEGVNAENLHILPIPLGGEDETSRLGVVAGSPRRPAPNANADGDDEDDDDMGILHVPVAAVAAAANGDGNNEAAAAGVVGVAANADEIEHHGGIVVQDDFSSHGGNALIPADSADVADRGLSASSSMMGRSLGDREEIAQEWLDRSDDPAKLWIPLNHPPEAVRLLLEYVYTNRVAALGREAHETAAAPVPPGTHNHLALLRPMVAPYSKKDWPDGSDGKRGHPTIPLSVALAGIQLAEEAQIPRLSLMCEVAASQLVSRRSVLDALALCNAQQQRTGNKLPILRKAAMLDHIFVGKSRGVSSLYKMSSFRKSLEDHPEDIVPSLLTGTLEAIKAQLGEKQGPDEVEKYHQQQHKHHHGHHHRHARRSHKRANAELERYQFKQLDDHDNAEREAERRKHRRFHAKKVSSPAAAAYLPDGAGSSFSRQLDIAFIQEDGARESDLGLFMRSGRSALPGQLLDRPERQSSRSRGDPVARSPSARRRRGKRGNGL